MDFKKTKNYKEILIFLFIIIDLKCMDINMYNDKILPSDKIKIKKTKPIFLSKNFDKKYFKKKIFKKQFNEIIEITQETIIEEAYTLCKNKFENMEIQFLKNCIEKYSYFIVLYLNRKNKSSKFILDEINKLNSF